MWAAIWIVSTNTKRPVKYNGKVVLLRFKEMERPSGGTLGKNKDDQYPSSSRPPHLSDMVDNQAL